MNTKTTLFKKGFTLIEAMVAVTMLSIVIVAIMSLAQSSLASNTYAQQQVTANYLAGEAIEYIRNLRDSQYLADPQHPATWLDQVNSKSSSNCLDDHNGGYGCDIDTINNVFTACSSAGCPALQFNQSTTNGYYQHSSGANSTFTRTIHIETINADEIAVRVIISGASGYFKNTPLVVVEHLFNWNNRVPEQPLPEGEQE